MKNIKCIIISQKLMFPKTVHEKYRLYSITQNIKYRKTACLAITPNQKLSYMYT